MLHMSHEEFEAFCKRTGRSTNGRLKKGAQQPTALEKLLAEAAGVTDDKKKPPKYRNQKVYVYEDGFVSLEKIDNHGAVIERFDSVKEYQRCGELRMLQKAGYISELDTQTTLVIQPTFQSRDGKKHHAITYRADFTYIENGENIVEDVKGFDEKRNKFLTTEAFNLKWKLLQAKYPNRIFRLY